MGERSVVSSTGFKCGVLEGRAGVMHESDQTFAGYRARGDICMSYMKIMRGSSELICSPHQFVFIGRCYAPAVVLYGSNNCLSKDSPVCDPFSG